MHLNFYESLEDRLLLKEIFRLFFADGDTLFFSFRREENLTDDDDLLRLRERVPREFMEHGDYIFLRKFDEEKFDSIGYLQCTDQTPGFLLDVWRYFYAFTVFIPKKQVEWDDYIRYVKRKGFDDIDGKRLLNDGLADFILIKGLGGDYLNVTFSNHIKLPAIDSLIR